MSYSYSYCIPDFKVIRKLILVFWALGLPGCISYTLSPDSPWQGVAFEINGSFVISMKLPNANIVEGLDEPAFIAVERDTSSRLFSAMYDPGAGKTRDLLLTTFWATVHPMDTPGRQEGKITFDEINAKFFVKDQVSARDFSYIGAERIGEIDWFLVNLKTQSKGVAYAGEIYPGYILIVGVRVFGADENVADLREFRIETLGEIVESIRIKQI